MNPGSTDTQTISYYDAHAAEFVADTATADMSDALVQFESLLPEDGRVLDWGCGSGRDSKAMLEAGFSVTAIDASPAMCKVTAQLADVEIRNESVLELDETTAYDGIWACASLLHLRREEIPEALLRAHRALKSGGILYASFKLGNFEGYRNGRWFTDLSESDLTGLLPSVCWQTLQAWESGDVRDGRGDERWLNFLARKI